MPIGGMIIQAGNSVDYHTGSWSSHQPRTVAGKCTGCMMCVNYCPDECMIVGAEGKVTGINKEMCKGCGVCIAVCPVKALEWDE